MDTDQPGERDLQGRRAVPGPDPEAHGLGKLRFLLTSAHQCRSPLNTALTSLTTLLEGYAGEISGKQRRVLEGADRKVRLALEIVNDMLAMNTLTAENVLDFFEAVDLGRLVELVVESLRPAARERGVDFVVQVEELPTVWAHRVGVRSVLYNLLDNAIRYTPRTGQVRLTLAYDAGEHVLRGKVSDTGIGIPAQEQERIFTDFHRAPNAKDMLATGTGLGLPIVRRAVEVHGGSLALSSAVGSPTTFSFALPLARVSSETLKGLARARGKGRRIVVIGGVAAGPKAAAKARRTDPHADISIVERGVFLCYAGCGLPYYVSGRVAEQKDLMASPIGESRDPEFFKRIKDIQVLSPAEAISIDRERKEVAVRHLHAGALERLTYDTLILATGSTPVIPDIPGIRKKNVFTLHGVEDAEGLRRELSAEKAKDAVIIGGGPLGIEVAEALTKAGARVTVIEAGPQILKRLDGEMAALVHRHLESHGVRILTNSRTLRVDGGDAASAVSTEDRSIPADLVVVATGTAPNVELARRAGIQIGQTGGIAVNEFLQTSDPAIFAAGDCAETTDLVTGRTARATLASTAHQQGRVAGINAAGGRERFVGSVRAMIVKVFELNVGTSGLTEREARAAGYDVESAIVPCPDRAHYYPTSRQLVVKLVADREDGRLLGAQILGPGDASKRLDVVTAMLSQQAPVEALSNLDHCHAPPYSTPLDCITIAANVLRNKLQGIFRSISAVELKKRMDRHDDLLVLDVRTARDYEKVCLPGAHLLPLASVRSRMNELPREKEIVVVCELGALAYEAALILQANAFPQVCVLDGGLAAWPYELVWG